MNGVGSCWKGVLLCAALAVPASVLGGLVPVVGGPVCAILMGMVLAPLVKKYGGLGAGITFTSKKILQYAVVLLGFGMNLEVVMFTGRQSLPIIVCTITVSLLIAFALHKAARIPSNISVLIGVGSSICGGSAVAATAPVINADDEEVAQAISVIFLFNIVAALIFPALGSALGFSTNSGEAFGIFAGTAVNDTSSVTAAASTWDNLYNLGSATLDKAVTVKLTRTLAIIPITLALAFIRMRSARSVMADNAGTERAGEGNGAEKQGNAVSLKKIFPFFILFFVVASVITTIASAAGVDPEVFQPLKFLSKFFIVMAMGAIGLHTDVVKLVKSGARPILLGLSCWLGITVVSLAMQRVMGLW